MLFSTFLLHGRPERVGHIHVCFVCVVLILSTLTVAAVVTQLVTVELSCLMFSACWEDKCNNAQELKTIRCLINIHSKLRKLVIKS